MQLIGRAHGRSITQAKYSDGRLGAQIFATFEPSDRHSFKWEFLVPYYYNTLCDLLNRLGINALKLAVENVGDYAFCIIQVAVICQMSEEKALLNSLV